MIDPGQRNPFTPAEIADLAKLRDAWIAREKAGGPSLVMVTDLIDGEVGERPLLLGEAIVTFERAAKRKLDDIDDWDLTGLDGLGG